MYDDKKLLQWFTDHALKTKGMDKDTAVLAAEEGLRLYKSNGYGNIPDLFEIVKKKARQLKGKKK